MISHKNNTNLANEIRVKLLKFIKEELIKKSLSNEQCKFLKNSSTFEPIQTKKNVDIILSKNNSPSSDDESMTTCNITPETYENHPSFKNSSFPLNRVLHGSVQNSPKKPKSRKSSISSCGEIIINNWHYILKNTSKYLSTFIIESKN